MINPREAEPKRATNPNPLGMGNSTNLGAPEVATIGLPEPFLQQHFDGQTVRVMEVWADGNKRGYVIVNAPTNGRFGQIGYVELTEGMNKVEALAAVRASYDRSAIVV